MTKAFSELRVGDKVDCRVAVLKGETKTGKRGPYLSFLLADSSGATLPAKQWEATARDRADCAGLCWAQAVGTVTDYNDQREITLSRPLCPADEPADPTRFLPAAPLALADLRQRLDGYVASVTAPPLHALLVALFRDDRELIAGFETLPAARSRHHAFRHGLLQHSLEVADVVDAICGRHQTWGAGRGRLSRDLAVTGALLHDIGKVDEFAADGHGVCLSAGGGLLGHVNQGLVRVAKKIALVRRRGQVAFAPDLEEMVLHLIASHHGRGEWGASRPPVTAEAALIHYADMISAECFYFAEAHAQAAPGDCFVRQPKLGEGGREVFVAPLAGIWDTPGAADTAPAAPPLPAAPMPLTLPLLRLVRGGENNHFATVALPLLGQIAAGQPILDTDSSAGTLAVEAGGLGLGSASYYLLRVQGDSMSGDGIGDGDLIVVRQQDSAEMGDMVVALLKDLGATVKRLGTHDGQICLRPSNPAHAPIPVPDPATLQIQGRVVAVAR